MIRKIKADGVQEVEFLAKLGERSRNTNKDVTETVSEIINNVMMNGDKAVREYTIKFDGKAPDAFEVPRKSLQLLLLIVTLNLLQLLKRLLIIFATFTKDKNNKAGLQLKITVSLWDSVFVA